MKQRMSKKELWSDFNLGRDLFIGRAKEYDEKLFDIMKKYLSKNTIKVFVEYGSGDGIWINYLSKLYNNITFIGIEWNDTQFDYSVKRCKNQKNIILRKRNVHDYFVKADMIFANGVIEHFTDHQFVLKQWLNLLNNNGYFLLTAPCIRNVKRTLSLLSNSKLSEKELLKKDIVETSKYGLEFIWSEKYFVNLFKKINNIEILTIDILPVELSNAIGGRKY